MNRKVLIAAMLVDTLGSGLLGSFELLYGHVVSGLSLGAAGAALSIAIALSIAAGPIAGAAVDRFDAGRVTVVANGVSAAGCALLLFAHGVLAFGFAVFVLSAGTRIFWAAFASLVSAIAAGGERRSWFGRIRSLRYAGIAGGQALAGPVLLIGEHDGLRALVAGDGASYVAALVLVRFAAPRVQAEASAPGYRDALRDRTNVALATLNVAATLLVTAPLIAMPVLVIQQLQLAAWLPGLLAALNTVAIAVPAFFVGRLIGRRSSLRVLAVAALVWAAGSFLYAIAATTPSVAYPLLALGLIALGAGEALYAPTADALPLELAPVGLAGRYTALHQLAWGVSGALAPALAAVLLTSGRATLWLVLGATALALAAAYALAAPVVAQRQTQMESSPPR